ncbi:hypothetical protein ABTC74_19420, partial [Acinetobacter baumannii]
CNLMPVECVKLFAMASRDVHAARQEFLRLYPVFAMQSQKSTLRVVQTGLDIIGQSVGPPRRPLRNLGPADREALKQVLAQLGIGAAR